MNVPETISYIKAKAERIDLNALFENPESHFTDLVDMIDTIKDRDQPMIVDINDLKNKVYEG